MKFDVVIGNPPYQQGGIGVNKTFYHKFYYVALSLKPNIIAFITPTTWLKSAKPMLRDLKNTLYSAGALEIRPIDSREVFGVSVDSLGVVFIDTTKGGSDPLISSDEAIFKKAQSATNLRITANRGRTKQFSKRGMAGQNGKGGVSLKSDSVFKYKTINRISHRGPEYIYCDTLVDDDNNSIRVAWGVISSPKNIGNVCVVDKGIQLTQMCCYQCVSSFSEAEVAAAYMQSKVFSFMLNSVRSNSTNSLGVVRQIPAVGLSRTWTDAELYSHFNLTEEEISLIETPPQMGRDPTPPKNLRELG